MGDIKGATRKKLATVLLEYRNQLVGQYNIEWDKFLHTDIQHEHSPGVMFTHQYIYRGNFSFINTILLIDKDDAGFMKHTGLC